MYMVVEQISEWIMHSGSQISHTSYIQPHSPPPQKRLVNPVILFELKCSLIFMCGNLGRQDSYVN